MWIGWALVMVGAGLLSILKFDMRKSVSIGLETVIAVGLGMLLSTTYFPVLAPLPVSENARALSLFAFLRSFGQVSLLSSAIQRLISLPRL